MRSASSLSPRKIPRQSRAKATVEAILDATTQVLVEDSYDGLTTNRVAELAGVSIGTVYQYFPNKDSLVTALTDRYLEMTVQLHRDYVFRMKEACLEEAVSQFVSALYDTYRVQPRLMKVLMEQVPRIDGLNRLMTLRAQMELTTREFLKRHRDRIREVDLDLAAFVVVRAVDSVVDAAFIERPDLLGNDQLAKETTELVLRYLGVTPPRDRQRKRPRP